MQDTSHTPRHLSEIASRWKPGAIGLIPGPAPPWNHLGIYKLCHTALIPRDLIELLRGFGFAVLCGVEWGACHSINVFVLFLEESNM